MLYQWILSDIDYLAVCVGYKHKGWLTQVPLVQGLHTAAHLAGLQSHWKVWLVGYSLPSSLLWLLTGLSFSQAIDWGPWFLLGCWPEATLSSLPCGLSTGLVTPWQLSLLGASEWAPKTETTAFLLPNLGGDIPSRLLYSILRSESLNLAHTDGEGIAQGHKYQSEGPLGTILEAADHSNLTQTFPEINKRGNTSQYVLGTSISFTRMFRDQHKFHKAKPSWT